MFLESKSFQLLKSGYDALNIEDYLLAEKYFLLSIFEFSKQEHKIRDFVLQQSLDKLALSLYPFGHFKSKERALEFYKLLSIGNENVSQGYAMALMNGIFGDPDYNEVFGQLSKVRLREKIFYTAYLLNEGKGIKKDTFKSAILLKCKLLKESDKAKELFDSLGHKLDLDEVELQNKVDEIINEIYVNRNSKIDRLWNDFSRNQRKIIVHEKIIEFFENPSNTQNLEVQLINEIYRDNFYQEIKVGDRILVSKSDFPKRAVIEGISQSDISFLMFSASHVLYTNVASENTEDMMFGLKPNSQNIWCVYNERWTFRNGNNGYFRSIIKSHWELTPQEVSFYKTSDPSTLIKIKKFKKKVAQKFKLIKLSKNQWMKENLNLLTFRNGDLIPLITDKKEWKECSKKGLPACCYYTNNKDKFVSRGLLYNIYAIKDPRGLAPEGWHIPSSEEYNQLIEFLGGTDFAGKVMRSQKGWVDGPFLYTSIFEGLPNGMRLMDGSFEGSGLYGQWVMQDDEDFSYVILRGEALDALQFKVTDFGNAYSVRCVKDK